MKDEEVNQFFYKALSIITYDLEMDRLIEVAMEVGEKNLKCMELLDKANTSSYGTPTPVKVPLDYRKRTFYCNNRSRFKGFGSFVEADGRIRASTFILTVKCCRLTDIRS